MGNPGALNSGAPTSNVDFDELVCHVSPLIPYRFSNGQMSFVKIKELAYVVTIICLNLYCIVLYYMLSSQSLLSNSVIHTLPINFNHYRNSFWLQYIKLYRSGLAFSGRPALSPKSCMTLYSEQKTKKLSHVNFKKRPCRPVRFQGRGP